MNAFRKLGQGAEFNKLKFLQQKKQNNNINASINVVWSKYIRKIFLTMKENIENDFEILLLEIKWEEAEGR